ncbi:MAG: chemotaxis protein CheX [Syntrophobacterales bacterium]|jgi:chemotaxis protein CheX|nr:chemotaxis protein CheX [Syntrophobacterales bacterium]
MNVRFINPFLDGTAEVLKTMTFTDAETGKAYLKKDDAAHGEISGIIGITGDIVGSLAVSFEVSCICGIVSSMLGEQYNEPTRDVLDAAGELTNMISGVARTRMEKDGLSVFAAIPSVVIGKDHTISHILKAPSIVIPFSTPHGRFVIDICVKATETNMKDQVAYDVVNKATLPQGKIAKTSPASPAAAAQTAAGKPASPPETASSPGEETQPESRLDKLKKNMRKLSQAREELFKELESQPFMVLAKRKEKKKLLDIYDDRLRKIKLDISTVQAIEAMDNTSDPERAIKAHFQDHVRNHK